MLGLQSYNILVVKQSESTKYQHTTCTMYNKLWILQHRIWLVCNKSVLYLNPQDIIHKVDVYGVCRRGVWRALAKMWQAVAVKWVALFDHSYYNTKQVTRLQWQRTKLTCPILLSLKFFNIQFIVAWISETKLLKLQINHVIKFQPTNFSNKSQLSCSY